MYLHITIKMCTLNYSAGSLGGFRTAFSLSLNHQGSGSERFGRAPGLRYRMSSGIFPDVLEWWRRPKAKNKATEAPFLVQRTDNICLQLEPSSGACRLTESPRTILTPKGIPYSTQIIQELGGSLSFVGKQAVLTLSKDK